MRPAFKKRIFVYNTAYTADDLQYVLNQMFPNEAPAPNISQQRRINLDEVLKDISEDYEASDQARAQIKIYTGKYQDSNLKLTSYQRDTNTEFFNTLEDQYGDIDTFQLNMALRPAAHDPHVKFELGIIEREAGVNQVVIFCNRFKSNWLKEILVNILVQSFMQAGFWRPVDSTELPKFHEAYSTIKETVNVHEGDIYMEEGEAQPYYLKETADGEEKKRLVKQETDFDALSELGDYVNQLSEDEKRVQFTTLGVELVQPIEDPTETAEQEVLTTAYDFYHKDGKKSLRLYSDGFDVGGQTLAAQLLGNMLDACNLAADDTEEVEE